MDKKTATMVSNEIMDMFQSWLDQSGFTKEIFLMFRMVKGFKIYKEKNEEGKLVLYFTFRNADGDTLLMGANLVAATEDEETFLVDARLLIRYMMRLLDDENKNNPINGSYMGDYFIEHSTKFFDIKN